jgi:SAM-dependent methyltransferase
MHDSVDEWLHRKVAQYDVNTSADVLEVGSLNVNGAPGRDIFTGKYVGIDLVKGDGVDKVVLPGQIPFKDESFPVVLSLECLEHDPRPWETINGIARVMAEDGILFLSARGFDERGCFPLHHLPDLWRFSEQGLDTMMTDAGIDVLEIESDPEGPGWLCIGWKP